MKTDDVNNQALKMCIRDSSLPYRVITKPYRVYKEFSEEDEIRWVFDENAFNFVKIGIR